MSQYTSEPRLRKRVIVVGGGITGLAAAHRLTEIAPEVEVQLVEAGSRLGGVLQTVHEDGFLIETSADNFITNVPWAVDLCKRIEFEQELIPTREAHRHAMALHRGKLHKVPDGFVLMSPTRMWPILMTRLLSLRGKLRLLGELFVPPSTDDDEALGPFVRRRFGREVFERLVQPLIGGIYTADPEKLSLAATLPRFLEMEREHGSLIRAARVDRRSNRANRNTSGARYRLFAAPRDGLSSLVHAIAARIPQGSIRLNSPVQEVIALENGRWSVTCGGQEKSGLPMDCDALILATPATHTARLVEGFNAALSQLCASIPYAGTALVILAYRREQLARPLDAVGFVVPEIEHRKILAASFSSVKYEGRAPDDHVLVRVFIGGACHGELLERSDEELQSIAHSELADILQINGSPQLTRIARWTGSMPQYHVGHLQLVANIEQAVARWPTLQLAGNAYRGVGIPYCIHSGEQAAERVVAQLTSQRRPDASDTRPR